jgi:hypothetical protein
MAIKTFTTGEVLTAADTNTYLANSGLVYITGGSLSTATTDFVGCFSSTFDNYRVVINAPAVSSAADIYFRLLIGTTPTFVNYHYVVLGANTAGTTLNTFGVGSGEIYTGWTTTSGAAGLNVGLVVSDITSPFLAKRTGFTGSLFSYQTAFKHGTFGGIQDSDTSHTGLRISTLTAATLTGTVTIYGYRKA